MYQSQRSKKSPKQHLVLAPTLGHHQAVIQKILFSQFSKTVGDQNNKYWCPEYSSALHILTLEYFQVAVYSTCKIAGPMFFKAAINSDEHVQLILTPFFRELVEVKMHSYFMQFNAMAQATYSWRIALEGVLIILTHNLHVADLYNVLYCCQCTTCFKRFFLSSSGAQICTRSIGYLSVLFVATATMDASSSSKQFWQIPDDACTDLSSWWWAEKPLETCRALTIIKNIIQRCILLVVHKNTLTMHGPMNVKKMY